MAKVPLASAIAVVAFLLTSHVNAQSTPPEASRSPQAARNGQAANPRDEYIERLNANTVTVVAGNPYGTYLFMGYDMAAVLDDGDKLRILPVLSKGGAQNVKDLLYLRGVDMGITQSNVLRHFSETGELGRIADHIYYIARLYNEEMHLLVRSNINSIEELKNKKVNFSNSGSGTQLTSRLVFKDLNIPVQEVSLGEADAIDALKRGEISAAVLIAGKPAGAFINLKADPSYKLLSIPYSKALHDRYLPATLTNRDYPGLIRAEEPVNTIAVSAVLAVFNWAPNTDRYRRVASFTEAFFDKFENFLHSPRHPKWKEVNLAAELPGWHRFPAAQEILNRDKTKSVLISNAELKAAFEQFITKLSPQEAASLTPKRRDELFARFLEWQAAQKTR